MRYVRSPSFFIGLLQEAIRAAAATLSTIGGDAQAATSTADRTRIAAAEPHVVVAAMQMAADHRPVVAQGKGGKNGSVRLI
jgi:hypothetical protein